MITTTRSLKVKLPQLSIKNLEKSKERSNKHTIRSNNNLQDRSNSPPKTRTDAISRGSISTPLQQCRYSCYNMCRVDSSFNDQEIFTASQKSVQRSNSNNDKIEKIDKLNQQIKNISADKPINAFSISNRETRKTEPYIKQPKSPSIKRRTEEKEENTVLNLKRQIKDKVSDLYSQVQVMLKNHKGYVRQQEKKNIFVQLVQLKKEFKLLNQNYNEFYSGPSQIVFDFELVDHMEQLRKLFDSKRPTKRNCGSLFDEDEISLVIPTEPNEKLSSLIIPEIQEQEIEQSQDQMEQITDQMTDCSPANSTSRRISKIVKRQTKQYTIQPIQIPQETLQQPVRRKSSIKAQDSPTTPLTPSSPSTITSRNNRFTAQQVLQQKLTIPQTPPKSKIQFVEDQKNEIKKEIQKRQSKLISRKVTLDSQNDKQKRSRFNSKGNILEVSEQMENEQQIIQQQVQSSQERNQNDMIINDTEAKKTQNEEVDKKEKEKDKQQQQFNLGQLLNTINQKKEKQKIQQQKISLQIEYLSSCLLIYDSQVLLKHRKIKNKNDWNEDIESILSNQYQFF